MTPRRAYGIHKRTAIKRGIEFHFSFEDWVAWWISHLGPDWMSKRGRKHGQYQMARKGDKGPYAAWNVNCYTQQENLREADRGKSNGKLTATQAKSVYQSSKDKKLLAARYGVTTQLIGQIQRGKKWKTVTQDLP